MTTNIDVLAGVAGRAIIDGVEHEVLDLTAEEYVIATRPELLVARAGEIIQRLVPTLSHDRIPKLTMKQQAAIIAIGTGVIDSVSALFPNAQSPEATTPPG